MKSNEDEASPNPLKGFPLGDCSSILLRDTKKSIMNGVRDTLRHYRSTSVSRSFLKDMESLISPIESLDSSIMLDEDTDSSDNSIFDNPKPVSINKNKPEKPILKSKPVTLVNTDIICELVKSVMSVGEKTNKIDDEIITYVVNCIVTDHQYGRLNFNKPLRNDTLSQLTKFIKNLYIDKHVTTYTDAFFDQMMGFFLLHDMDGSLENPRFYKTFDNIWKYDQEEMLCYDENYFRSIYMSSDSLKLTLSKTSNAYGFFYNLKKFKYYSSRKIRLNRLASNLDGLSGDDASEEYIDLAQINKRAQQQTVPPRKSQIVIDFCPDLEIRTFDQQDPSNVFID